MKSNSTGIAVLEGRWWPDTNVSARGLFDLIAELSCGNPHGYHYEMANSEAAFKESIPRIASYSKCRFLCIATHGDENGLYMMNNDKFSRTELRNILVNIKKTRGSYFSGLHLSSCLVGTQKVANFLFEKDVGIKWLAGYRERVDWIESSALDLLFFNALVSSGKNTSVQKIEDVAQRLMEAAPGLIKRLGFGIYVRKRGTGGAKDICSFESLG